LYGTERSICIASNIGLDRGVYMPVLHAWMEALQKIIWAQTDASIDASIYIVIHAWIEAYV
jgi:hypothetical protein